MSEDLLNIMSNGFMIYPSNGKFIVKKQAVPNNNIIIEEQEFDSYAKSIDYEISVLQKPKLQSWTGIIRYNRGLGIEYKNLNEFQAENKENAMVFAKNQIEILFAGSKINVSEIKLMLKN